MMSQAVHETTQKRRCNPPPCLWVDPTMRIISFMASCVLQRICFNLRRSPMQIVFGRDGHRARGRLAPPRGPTPVMCAGKDQDAQLSNSQAPCRHGVTRFWTLRSRRIQAPDRQGRRGLRRCRPPPTPPPPGRPSRMQRSPMVVWALPPRNPRRQVG